MILSIQIGDKTYQFDEADPLHISIPMNFNGSQPNAYGVERAESKPCEAEGIIGDTRLGGSVNFEQVKFIPHCNGTHTECVGHITHERISVHDCLRQTFILAKLVSVQPEKALGSNETYSVDLKNDDLLITRKELMNFKWQFPDLKCEALIIRTLPNHKSKLTQTYLEKIPPFFSTEAMEFIVSLGIKHLLCDLPSIDRIFDGGKLSNHRIFWNVKQGSFEATAQSFLQNTITELIYVPNEIADGDYLLNLQIAPFQADASPSRPILYKMID